MEQEQEPKGGSAEYLTGYPRADAEGHPYLSDIRGVPPQRGLEAALGSMVGLRVRVCHGRFAYPDLPYASIVPWTWEEDQDLQRAIEKGLSHE